MPPSPQPNEVPAAQVPPSNTTSRPASPPCSMHRAAGGRPKPLIAPTSPRSSDPRGTRLPAPAGPGEPRGCGAPVGSGHGPTGPRSRRMPGCRHRRSRRLTDHGRLEARATFIRSGRGLGRAVEDRKRKFCGIAPVENGSLVSSRCGLRGAGWTPAGDCPGIAGVLISVRFRLWAGVGGPPASDWPDGCWGISISVRFRLWVEVQGLPVGNDPGECWGFDGRAVHGMVVG